MARENTTTGKIVWNSHRLVANKLGKWNEKVKTLEARDQYLILFKETDLYAYRNEKT